MSAEPREDILKIKNLDAEREADEGSATLEGETSKVEQAEGMEKNLQAVEAANSRLEGDVDSESVTLGVETALANPEDVASDTQRFIELLPGVDPNQAKELADVADALVKEVEEHGPEDAGMKAKVEAFCREKLGASLSEAMRNLAEMTVPGLDLKLAAKVLSGEARGRDFVKFASKAIAPPLGELVYNGFLADDQQTRELLADTATKGQLGATFLRALQVIPGASVLTRPAAGIVERIAKRQRALVERPGKITNMDIARAIMGGIVPKDKTEAKEMVQAIAGVARDPERLDALGLDGNGRKMIELIAQQAEKDPNKIVDALHGFVGDDELEDDVAGVTPYYQQAAAA